VIFVTVGTQLPFDRLVRGVDEWAARSGRGDVFAQIGPTSWRPRHIEAAPFVSPEEHRRRMESADAIVGHAGMGTIIGAMELGKPVLIMPRMAGRGEHRNDHQVATTKRFEAVSGVAVAWDEQELPARLEALLQMGVGERIASQASERLITAIRQFVDGDWSGRSVTQSFPKVAEAP
jgi:UDP-N-acetylglucosamine transferase subunit ALG13